MTYLRILHLAAQHLECDVAAALATLLAGDEAWNDTDVAHMLDVETAAVPMMEQPVPQLHLYDQLLTEVGA